MKSIFITFDQTHLDDIVVILEKHNCRGYTLFDPVKGRGTKKGEPHQGSHAWPSLNSAIITIIEDHRVDDILEKLQELDCSKEKLGLRAFVWDIEKTI